MAPLEETRAALNSAELSGQVRKPPQLQASAAWTDDYAADEEAQLQNRMGEILDKVQEQVFKRRLRVKEAFRDFDKLQCGRCTQMQFARALKMICPHLDLVEVELVVNHFKVAQGRRVQWPQVYNYVAFCNHIEEVFAPPRKQLEGHPSMKVYRAGSQLSYKNGANVPQMTEEEETRFWDVLHRCAVLTQTRGVDLYMAFMDGIRQKHAAIQLPRGSGKITEAAFRHKFPFVGQFSEDDMELLLKKYRCYFPSGVQVSAFIKDCFDLLEEKERRERMGIPRGMSRGDSVQLEMPPSRSESRQVSKSSSAAELRRPQAAAEEQEPSALGLSRSGSDAALQERPVPQNRPSSAVKSMRTVERNASAPSISRPKSAALGRSGALGRSQAVPQVDVMTKLRQLATERRLRFGGVFGDFDKLNKGAVTLTALKTALTVMRVELSSEERNQLFELYRGEENTFRYKDFLVGIDQVMAEGHSEAKKGASRYKAELDADETARLATVKAMLARRVQLRRMEITTCFHDFCKRSATSTAGHVTASLVGRILTVLGFVVSADDVELLCKAYCDTVDGQGFNYLDFCADVDPRLEDAGFEKKQEPKAKGFRYFDDHGQVTKSIYHQKRPGTAPCRLLRA